MPIDFEKCVDKGGRVRTRKLRGLKYQRVCFDSLGAHPGHVQTRRKKKK